MSRYRIVHDTFEGSNLVVRHVFFGRTPDEAMAIYKAHKKSDRFLRDCDDLGNFEGRFRCSTRSVMLGPGDPMPLEP